MKAYKAKIGRLPPTEVWCGYDTDAYWDRVKKAIETGKEFEDDDAVLGAAI